MNNIVWKVVARFPVVEDYVNFYSPQINQVMPDDIDWFMMRVDEFTDYYCIGLLIPEDKYCEVQKQILSLHLKFGKVEYHG